MEKNVTYYLRQKGLCFKNALSSPLLLRKRTQIVGQFYNPTNPSSQRCCYWEWTHILPHFLIKQLKRKSLEIFWSLAAAGGPSGCCPRSPNRFLLTKHHHVSKHQASISELSKITFLKLKITFKFHIKNTINSPNRYLLTNHHQVSKHQASIFQNDQTIHIMFLKYIKEKWVFL